MLAFGGVGRVATQIALVCNAEIVGSCSATRFNEARDQGVQEVVDYRAFDCSEYRGRFDVVFDTHGALSLSQCNTLLKRGGVALHIVPTLEKNDLEHIFVTTQNDFWWVDTAVYGLHC